MAKYYQVGNGIISSGINLNSSFHDGKDSMTVLSGGTAINTTVNYAAYMTIYPEGTADSTEINGGSMYISSGGTARSIKLNEDGYLIVLSGGTAIDVVENGGRIDVVDGASVNFVPNEFFEISVNGRLNNIHSGTTANSTSIVLGGQVYISSGGTARDTAIKSSGYLYVSHGGTANQTTVNDYGEFYVLSGGIADHTTVNSGGSMYISSGGTAFSIVENGGCVFFDDDANVTFAPNVFSELNVVSRHINIHSGTTANSVTLSSGSFNVCSGGITCFPTVNLGGYLSVLSGGTATEIIENGGYVNIEDGASVSFAQNTISDLYLYKTSATVHSGTETNNARVTYGGTLEIYSKGIANDTIVSGGNISVLSSGVVNSSVVYSSGRVDVSSGGVANSTTLNYNCKLYASSGGTALSTLNNGGDLVVLMGGVVAYTTNASGIVYVSSGGIACDTTINGGYLEVFSGGTANKVSINSSYLYISSGGTATDVDWTPCEGHVYVSDGGHVTFTSQYSGIYYGSGNHQLYNVKEMSSTTLVSRYVMNVMSKGIANSIIVDSGGKCYVFLDGCMKHTTINQYGSMVVSSGGTASFTTVCSGGLLQVFSCGMLTGRIILEDDAVVSVTQKAIVDFDISNLTPGASARINNLASIQGTPTYTITVSASQNNGSYILANNADFFNSSITIQSVLKESIGTIFVDETVEINKDIYTLSLKDNSLVLTIAENKNIDTIIPTVSNIKSDITLPTNQQVTITAVFADDVELAQSLYKLGEVGEWTAYMDGVTVKENGTAYFKAVDTSGNESEIVSYTVSNIDKVAPSDPTGVRAFVERQDVALLWNGSTDDRSGVKEYVVTYSINGQEFTVRTSNTNYVLNNADFGSYSWSVQAVDFAGNESAVTDGDAFVVSGFKPYTVEYSPDNFEHVITFTVTTPELDAFRMPGGIYQMRVRQEGSSEWISGDPIVAEDTGDAPQLIKSEADGNADVFFANSIGTWESGYLAQHVGSINDWSGTNEYATVFGKNKLADIIEGSTDANILLMTDDDNGDTLFVDDIYTASPGNMAEQQARIAQIDEIRAGVGADIVDMTSQQYEYSGNGLTIRGGEGNDTIWANKGNNWLFGDAGNDRIIGASGDDVIVGGIGNDRMHGGGGNDVFTFCDNWGVDNVEQLATGSVTLWFASGDESNWNAETLTYMDSENSVKVSGVTADKVTLKFGDDGSAQFASLANMGAFFDATSERIFEESGKGMLASL